MIEKTLVGKKIFALRKRIGFTQNDLAKLINITPQAISKWENGVTLPDTCLLPILSELFSVSIEELLCLDVKGNLINQKSEINHFVPPRLKKVNEWWNSDLDGYSIINYKNKQINYVDYTYIGHSKEKTIQLISIGTDEICKYSPKSVLELVNVSNFHFDTEVLNVMKDTRKKISLYEKKVAILGMKPIHQVAYDFILEPSDSNFIKVFNTEIEANEWLIAD